MTTEIWVMKVTSENSADDGISHFTHKGDLAEAVLYWESFGASVQVYKCVPVSHDAYRLGAVISLDGE